MSKQKEKKIVNINNFPLTIETNDSEIIINDDAENKIKISKDNKHSILLNIKGMFHSGKNNQDL